jgi:hypothetical protein
VSAATTVRDARPGDAGAVAGVLRRVFDTDPLIGWFLRADERREEALGDFVSISIAEYRDEGHRIDVVEVDGAVAGTAL